MAAFTRLLKSAQMLEETEIPRKIAHPVAIPEPKPEVEAEEEEEEEEEAEEEAEEEEKEEAEEEAAETEETEEQEEEEVEQAPPSWHKAKHPRRKEPFSFFIFLLSEFLFCFMIILVLQLLTRVHLRCVPSGKSWTMGAMSGHRSLSGPCGPQEISY